MLGGFSQGAAMATELFMHPKIQNRVLGLVLISGKLVRPEKMYSSLMKTPVPVVWMHGERDHRVSIEAGLEIPSLFKEAGWEVEEIRHEKGHMIPVEFHNSIRKWLEDIV